MNDCVKSMDNIMNIQGVECFEKDDVIYLKLETVARGLGFTTIAASGNEVVRWNTVHKYLCDLGVATSCNDMDYRSMCPDFIPENIFYRLAMKAKNEAAQRFQAKIADEVIPAIRKTGCYQLAPAADQQHKQLDTLQKIQFILDVQAKKMKEDQQAASYWRRAYRDKLEAVKIYKQNISLWRKIFRKVLDGDMDCLDRLETELPAWYDQAKAISTARYPTFEECMDILTAPIEEDEE